MVERGFECVDQGFLPLLVCALAQAVALEKSHNRRRYAWWRGAHRASGQRGEVPGRSARYVRYSMRSSGSAKRATSRCQAEAARKGAHEAGCRGDRREFERAGR